MNKTNLTVHLLINLIFQLVAFRTSSNARQNIWKITNRMKAQQRSEMFEVNSINNSIKKCMSGLWHNAVKIVLSLALYYRSELDKSIKNFVEQLQTTSKQLTGDWKNFAYVMVSNIEPYVENQHRWILQLLKSGENDFHRLSKNMIPMMCIMLMKQDFSSKFYPLVHSSWPKKLARAANVRKNALLFFLLPIWQAQTSSSRC